MAVWERSRVLASGLIVLAGLICSQVQAVSFEALYYSVDSFDDPGRSRIAVADVDGDELPDLVLSATTGNEEALIVAGKQINGDFAIKQRLLVPTGTDVARVLVRQVQGLPRVLAIGQAGTTHEFAGWPLAPIRSFSTVPAATAAAVGDIDADGKDDLVIVSRSGLATYSLVTGNLVRSRPLPDQNGSDVALAQLDGDPALEIVVAGNIPGLVVDGATNAIDWSYIDGFGKFVAMGQLGSAGLTGWVGAKDYQLYTVFRASPWSPLWSGMESNRIGAIATARLDAVGPDVIAVGNEEFQGGLRIVDSVTHLQRFQIRNPGSAVNAIASGDFNGDGLVDIAFASSYPNYAPDLVIADGTTGNVLWSFQSEGAPLTRTVIGDVDGDGRLELVALSYRMGESGELVISDFLSGAEKWRKPTYVSDPASPLNFQITHLKLVPKATGTGTNILLAGALNTGAGFVVMDGVDKSVSTYAGQFATNTLVGNQVNDLELVDYNGDGIQDFVTLSYAVSTASGGAYIHVFSGVDGTPLWISPPLKPPFQSVENVVVVGRDSPAPKIVAILGDELLAFDVHTGAASWTLPLSTTVDGGTLLHDGANGEELILFRRSGQVLVYAADTQALLTGFALSAPLDAITTLSGQQRIVLAQSANRLTFADASTGTILATTEYLGAFTELSVPPSKFRATDSTWYVAVGSSVALYRKRLVLNENIFTSTFDGQPPSAR